MMNSARRGLTLQVGRISRQNTLQLHNSWKHHHHHSRSSQSASGALSVMDFHSLAVPNRRREDKSYQLRPFHSTVANDRAVAVVLGLATLSAVSYAGSSAVQSYTEWKAAQPSPEELEKQRKEQEATQAKQNVQDVKQDDNSKKPDNGQRENIFKEWFGVGVGARYYEGGFEDTMTRREAALILGVRESTTAARIKDAHRKLLILNHPDTGGSTYLSGKLNEAKELLLKGKSK